MDPKKCESDEDYWQKTSQPYDFSSDDSGLSSTMRNDELNQLDLLRDDGLVGIIDCKSIPQTLSDSAESGSTCSTGSRDSSILIVDRKTNPMKGQKIDREETVKSMIFGSEYSLDMYKGKDDKIELLVTAMNSHDGNAILEVVLFLRSTLKKSVFQREIVQHTDAINVYLAYLEEDHETDELDNMLLLLDKYEDAAIAKYEAAVNIEHPETKLKWIENCLSTHLQPNATSAFLRESVEEHKHILAEQMKLEKYAHNSPPLTELKNSLLFEELTGKGSVVDSSVLCSLIFCCLNYYNSGELQHFASPEKIKSNYHLSKKQFTWAALRALSASKKWSEVDELFVSKSWLRGLTVRSCITFTRLLEVVSAAKAPADVMKRYLLCVDNVEERLTLAKKYECHSIIIEYFKTNRDRLGLIKYKGTLQAHTFDFCLATDILNNPAIKWKN